MNLEGMKKKFRYQKLSFEDLVLLIDKRKDEDSFVVALEYLDKFYIYENGETHEILDKENFEIVCVRHCGEYHEHCQTGLYGVLAASPEYSDLRGFTIVPLDIYNSSFGYNYEPYMLPKSKAKREINPNTNAYLNKFLGRERFRPKYYYELYNQFVTQKHIDYLQDKLNFELKYLEFIENNLLSDNDMEIMRNEDFKFESDKKNQNPKSFGE